MVVNIADIGSKIGYKNAIAYHNTATKLACFQWQYIEDSKSNVLEMTQIWSKTLWYIEYHDIC